ncbi:hypothetical protein D9611_012920 [Ephemerocybe angulata]|uniref:Uncharacterized protein n=1 Tax=Ephemerocybe angulata TaxID=980116 RepID=A0A8H5FFR8_9AGAR|nr:hypothetical protein D9611_012920 [Tulosesus angulatus]
MPGPMPGSGKTENQAATEENPSRRAGQRTARTRSASATLPTPVSQQRATSRCTTLNDPEDQTTRCDKPAAHGQPEPDRCWEHHRQCGEHCKKYKEAQEEADRVLEGKRLPNEADIARYTSRKETTKDMEWVSKYSEAIGTEMTERVIHSKRFFLKPDKGHQTRINRLKEEKENADWVIGKLQERHQKLERIALLEGARKSKKDLEDAILKVEEDATAQVSKTAKSMISQAIECIGRGKLGGDVPCIPLPTYPGLSGAWNYAREIRLALLASVDAAVRGAEEEAVMIAKIGMERIKELADKHLPPGIERNTRHLQAPSTMFSGSGSHSRLLGQRPDLTEPTVFDLFDVNHQLSEHSNDGKANSEDPGATEPNALTLAIVGFGALTMVRGWAPGRAILRSIVRVANLFSKGTLRNCAALIIGAIWLRATTYHILDFPSTIPRTVGRRLKWSFVQGHGRVSFVDAHVTRAFNIKENPSVGAQSAGQVCHIPEDAEPLVVNPHLPRMPTMPEDAEPSVVNPHLPPILEDAEPSVAKPHLPRMAEDAEPSVINLHLPRIPEDGTP